MIAQLRTSHRVVFILLALAGPVLLVGGLYVRKLPQTMPSFPPILPSDLPISGDWWLNDNTLWEVMPIQTRLYGTHKRMILELAPSRAFTQPDILVIWQQGEALEYDSDKAYLLGSLSARQTCRFRLPPDALDQNGRLFLYSLAYDQQIASCALPSKEAFQGDFRPEEEF